MHRSRLILGCMALVLTLVLLIPLAGCGGGGTSATATPTGTSTGATATPTGTSTGATTTPTKTPTATKTPTSTSTSGNTLSDILGGGKNIGDVKFDIVMTSAQSSGLSITGKEYYKNYGAKNQMKMRTEMSVMGMTSIEVIDYSTLTGYMWTSGATTATKLDLSTIQKSDPTANADQVHITHLGTETVDGHPCDVYQWSGTEQGTTGTVKAWIWTAKSLPVKMEISDSTGIQSTIEYKNIVFGNLDDSLFQLPAGMTVT